MIVYLHSHAFGVTKTHRGRFVSREFPIEKDISAALLEAVRWEAEGTAKAAAPKRQATSKLGSVGTPITQYVKGTHCVVVPYVDKNGRHRKLKQPLPETGEDKVIQDAYRRAHVMAGRRLADYSLVSPLP